MEWVHVREEMPDGGQTVLIATAGGSIGVGYFSGEGGWVVEFLPWGQEEGDEDEIEVTWWMLMPLHPSWQRCPTGEPNHSALKVQGLRGGLKVLSKDK